MSLKYIVFRDLDSAAADPHFVVAFMQELRHVEVAAMLRDSDPKYFSTAVGGGFAVYDPKTKLFRTFGDAASLNLVAQENDAQYVNKALLTKGTAEAFMVPAQTGGWYLLLASEGIVPKDDFSKKKIYGRGSLAHHIHNSDHPFRVKFEEVKGFKADTGYVEYCELALAA